MRGQALGRWGAGALGRWGAGALGRWGAGGGGDDVEPRRRYNTRPVRPRLSSGPPRRTERPERPERGPGHLGPPPPPSGPLLDASGRWRWRSWLVAAIVVLLLIALLLFAYIVVQLVFPQ